MSREAILDVAIKLLVENKAASMQDIARAAGVGRTTLHRYYPSRDDLMRALIISALADAEQAIATCHLEDDTALEAIERIIDTFIPIGHRFHFLLTEHQFDTDPEIRARTAKLDEIFDALMQKGQQEGGLRKDLSARWLNYTLTALLFVSWEHIRDGYLASRDASRVVMTTFTSGVGLT